MATMRDVAERAEVSLATVSHVINRTRYVSPELIERVQSALDELNYRPDAIARSLRRRETLTIGLLVPSTEIPFFASVAYHIEKVASAKGYNVIFCNSGWRLAQAIEYFRELLARRVDGLICISPEVTAVHILPILEAGTPIVMFERQLPDRDLDGVGINNSAGAYTAVKHLLQLGHRSIAFIQGLPNSTVSDERLAGCKKALEEAGCSLKPELLMRGDYLPESGKEAAAVLLEREDPSTAIFAFNDLMALGVLQFLQARGVRVPEDIAVMGFDDIPMAKYLSPALTTVRQPLPKMAELAVDLLLARIQENNAINSQYVRFEPELIIRDSTKKFGSALP